MRNRALAAGLFAWVAISPFALAQGSPPANQTQQGKQSGIFIQTLESGKFRASDLMGQDVYNQQDEGIGSIGDVILDRNGQISAVVIDLGGIGAEVAVRYDAFRFEPEKEPAAQAVNGSGDKAGRSSTSSAPDRAAGGQAGGTDPSTGSAGKGAGNPPKAKGSAAEDANESSARSSDTTVHARIVLNVSRDDLQNAPKLDDSAARAPSQSGPQK
jgi:hypothetical protein